MAAAMSAPYMIPGPSAPIGSNNQAAVAGLLRYKYLQSKSAAAPSSSMGLSRSAISSAPSPSSGCPMHRSGASPPAPPSVELNPDNNIAFNLATTSSWGSSRLSSERSVSSIPRGANSPAPGASPYDKSSACPVAHDGNSGAEPSRWEYPSPAQFQAALTRKNKAAPEEHVEMMVMVHNFLNEQAWKQVLEWERLFVSDPKDVEETSLLRFQGRPGELSPRARWYAFLGSVWPSHYASEPPFDRHDWVVGRADGSTARYVIDYYGDDEADARDEHKKQIREQRRRQAATGGQGDQRQDDDEDDEQANFVLDVRPAIDSFDALRVRAAKAFKNWQSSAPQ